MKYLSSVSIIMIGCFTLLSCSKDEENEPPIVPEDLYINEIYSNGAGEDWLELYNASAVSKNVEGYTIFDDETNKYILPAGTSIPANGYLVLLCDGLSVGLHTNFKLSSEGESIYLDNKAGERIDKVTFPAMGKGQSYGRFADGTINLAITGSPTSGAANGASQAPAFVEVIRDPLVPSLTDVVTIQTQLTSNTGIQSVKLFYRINGGAFTAADMVLNGAYYNGKIPAAQVTGQVQYYIEVKNSDGQIGHNPVDAPDDFYSYILNDDVLPSIVINEFMAVNTSCCPDGSSGMDEFDDWIELYNAGSQPVNIAGMYLSDDKSDPFKSKIPSDSPAKTTIQPGGFLVVWADESKLQGALHVNFKLSAAGEDVGVFYVDGRIIDSYNFGVQTENISWGRITNGGATWKSFAAPTQGTTNN